jgi:hypothetical protein
MNDPQVVNILLYTKKENKLIVWIPRRNTNFGVFKGLLDGAFKFIKDGLYLRGDPLKEKCIEYDKLLQETS